jgi:hypothetical protein
MHKELSDVFAECRKPRHACKKKAADQLRPILDVVALLQQQAAVHRQNLLAAELSADDPDAVRGHLERLHQTLGALDTDVKALIDTGRRVALSMAQFERYSGEIEASLEKAS